jgi:hypothetical protein
MEILPKFKGIAVHDGFKSYNRSLYFPTKNDI